MVNGDYKKKVEKGESGNDNGCRPYSYLEHLLLHFPNYPSLSLSSSNYNYSLSCSCSTHSLHQHQQRQLQQQTFFFFLFLCTPHTMRERATWIELKNWIDLFRIQLRNTLHYSQLRCVRCFVRLLRWWKPVRIVAWRWRSTCDRSSARRRFRDARIAWASFQGSLRCIYSTQCVTDHCVIISNSFHLFACIACFPFPFWELVNRACGDLDPRLLCRINLERLPIRNCFYDLIICLLDCDVCFTSFYFGLRQHILRAGSVCKIWVNLA